MVRGCSRRNSNSPSSCAASTTGRWYCDSHRSQMARSSALGNSTRRVLPYMPTAVAWGRAGPHKLAGMEKVRAAATVTWDEAVEFATEAYIGCGVPPEDARKAAEGIV